MKIEAVLSTLLYNQRKLTANHTTVVVDVLRATTTICAALQAGADEVLTTDSLEQLQHYTNMGYTPCAERYGQKVANAVFGNSPVELTRHDLHDKRLALSTTNGTVAIALAADSEPVLLGSFINLSALANVLAEAGRDVVVLCSGSQGVPCLEDTLFCGALIAAVTEKCRLKGLPSPTLVNDCATMALTLSGTCGNNYMQACNQATHAERLRQLGYDKDIEYSFTIDSCDAVPVLIPHTSTFTRL